MKFSVPLLLGSFMLVLTGCAGSPHGNINKAWRAYDQGDCQQANYQLSQAERRSRSRAHLQPEISLLRGLCLERQALYVDAVQTYRWIIRQHPSSEYAWRAGARLETLRQLGHHDPDTPLPPEKR